jgi:hypothetical protein
MANYLNTAIKSIERQIAKHQQEHDKHIQKSVEFAQQAMLAKERIEFLKSQIIQLKGEKEETPEAA